MLWYLPYLQLGMRVVAVEYRLSGRAPAPAAVEDARCAFLWLAKNGAQYGVDPNRIVITGGSAGGHLALMTAFLDDSMDKACGIPGPAPKARAVVDYYGATDLLPLVPEDKPHRSKWLSGPYDPVEMARRMSPLTWVRPGLPPVLMLHGDADKSVPYSDSVRLGEALSKVGVANELVTVPGGAHGRHTRPMRTSSRRRRIEAFRRILALSPVELIESEVIVMRNRVSQLLAMGALAVLFVISLRAQTVTGTITGTVADQTARQFPVQPSKWNNPQRAPKERCRPTTSAISSLAVCNPASTP